MQSSNIARIRVGVQGWSSMKRSVSLKILRRNCMEWGHCGPIHRSAIHVTCAYEGLTGERVFA